MFFKNEESSLKLEIVQYEFPSGGGLPNSDDRCWLVMRCTWVDEDGGIHKDSNSCLLTYELKEMAVELKVLNAGLKNEYRSDFREPYFKIFVQAEREEEFYIETAFYLPNTMDGDDTAEISCRMNKNEMAALVAELERLCEKFPDRA